MSFDNFRYVLDTARAPYFMWLPADDFVLPGLLGRAVAVLDARPDVVSCVPRVEFLERDGTRRRAPGTFALMGALDDNLRLFLRDPMDNSRFYGLVRRDALRRVLPARGYHAFDWVVSVGLLLAGKHWELDEVLLVREANDPDKYTRMIDAAFTSAPARLLPLLPFTRALLFDLKVPPSPGTLWALARLNVVYHVVYSLYRYPRYGELYDAWQSAIRDCALWRDGNTTWHVLNKYQDGDLEMWHCRIEEQGKPATIADCYASYIREMAQPIEDEQITVSQWLYEKGYAQCIPL